MTILGLWVGIHEESQKASTVSKAILIEYKLKFCTHKCDPAELYAQIQIRV